VHDLCQARLVDTEDLQCLADPLEFLGHWRMWHFGRQGGDLEGGPPLLRAAAAHEVDQKTAHGAAGVSQKAGTIGERAALSPGQGEMRCVEQRSGTQGEQRTAPQLTLREPVQLTVEHGEQPIARAGFALFCRPNQLLELLLQHAARLPAPCGGPLFIEHAPIVGTLTIGAWRCRLLIAKCDSPQRYPPFRPRIVRVSCGLQPRLRPIEAYAEDAGTLMSKSECGADTWWLAPRSSVTSYRLPAPA